MRQFLYILPFILVSTAFADTKRIKEVGGRVLVDGGLKVTGDIIADRTVQFIDISTPTTPSSGYGRMWFNNTSHRLCIRFDDGTISCLGPGTVGGGALSGVTYPLVYDSVGNTLSLDPIGIDTGTTSSLPTSRLTGASLPGGSTSYIQNQNSLQSGAIFYVASGTVLGPFLATTVGLTGVPGTLQSVNGGMGIFSNTADIYVTPKTNGRFSLSQGSTFTIVSGDGLGYVGLRSSDSVTTTVWTLPRAGGLNKQRLATDAFNNLYFIDPADGLTVSLSTGVTGILSISTQTNLTASGNANMNGSVVNVGPINIGTGTLGPFNVTATSASAMGTSGLYSLFGVNGGSVVARNIASGTQCVHADSSGNLTGTGSDCASTAGFASLSATNTWTASQIHVLGSSVTFYGPIFTSSFTNYGVLVSTGGIKGTANGDIAASGIVGEWISSATLSNTNFPSNNTWGDLASITLTAGDWDISFNVYATYNSATVTQFGTFIGTTAGNSSTGLAEGDNYAGAIGPTAAYGQSTSVTSYRTSITSTTTYYLKYLASYSVATPQAKGRISARRMR